MQRLVFVEKDLHRMCREKSGESVTQMENGADIILFNKLKSKVKVMGLFGDPVQLLNFIGKSDILPKSFIYDLTRSPTLLPFGIYAVTLEEELTWIFLWSPSAEHVERSITVTSQRILQEVCEQVIWFMDISSDDVSRFIESDHYDENSIENDMFSVGKLL